MFRLDKKNCGTNLNVLFLYKKFNRSTDRQIGRITGGQTDRQDDRQKEKLDNIKTDTQTYRQARQQKKN
jgi:hypothetical protein